MPDMNENAETQQEYLGRCHDCTAPQTEVNMLSRHILELQADKGRLIDNVNDLEDKLANADYQLEGRDNEIRELNEKIEKMKCGGNCKHLYHVNTGDCYDAKCDLTGCDCTNCKDEWELRR